VTTAHNFCTIPTGKREIRGGKSRRISDLELSCAGTQKRRNMQQGGRRGGKYRKRQWRRTEGENIYS